MNKLGTPRYSSLGELPPPPQPRRAIPAAGLGTGTMKWLDHWIGLPLCFASSLLARLARRVLPTKKRELVNGDTIAVFKFFGLGSIMQATPLLRAIRRSFPRSRLVFVTFSANRELLARLELCDDVRAIRTRSLMQFTVDTVRELFWLRHARVRAVLDLEFFSKFSTLLAYFTGAPMRVAFHLNDFWRYSLITHPIYFNYFRHVSDLYGHAAGRIGVAPPDSAAAVEEHSRLSPLKVPDEARPRAEHLLRLRGWLPGSPVLGVNVNAGDVSLERRWPLERFAVVIDTFLRSHPEWLVVLTGSPNETEYVSSLTTRLNADLVSRVLIAAGAWSLDEFLAGLGLFRIFLTNDSGPMHIAAAFGVPMVSLWGPGRPAFYSPASPHHIEIYERFPCSPCLYMFTTFEGMWCGHEGWCMSAIEPAAVLAALEKLVLAPSSDLVAQA